jgi:hypothetical protein
MRLLIFFNQFGDKTRTIAKPMKQMVLACKKPGIFFAEGRNGPESLVFLKTHYPVTFCQTQNVVLDLSFIAA